MRPHRPRCPGRRNRAYFEGRAKKPVSANRWPGCQLPLWIFHFGGGQDQLATDDLVAIPPLAGYALGFEVVQAYLKRTGRSVVEAQFFT